MAARRAAATGRSRRTRRLPRRSTSSGSRSTRRRQTHARATLDGAVLAAAGVHVESGALELLGELVPGDGPGRDRQRRARGRDPRRGRPARARRTRPRRPRGRRRASRRRRSSRSSALWRELAARALRRRSSRSAAAARRTSRASPPRPTCAASRGSPVPTTLVGQVDAAIGGKTAIDLPGREEPRRRVSLAGADVDRPRAARDAARRRSGANGLAEVVKTGLLAGEPIWELPQAEQVRRCAAFKTALCLRDPHDRGERSSAQPRPHVRARTRGGGGLRRSPHGRAVALGLLAALRLSGLDDRRRRGDAPAASRSASTATRRGRRSRATRRPSTGRLASCCSRRPASRASASRSRGRRACRAR